MTSLEDHPEDSSALDDLLERWGASALCEGLATRQEVRADIARHDEDTKQARELGRQALLLRACAMLMTAAPGGCPRCSHRPSP